MRYEDFTLQIRSSPISGKHEVHVTSSLAGSAHGSIEIPREWPRLAPESLESFLDIAAYNSDAASSRDFQPEQVRHPLAMADWLGRELFDRLFKDQIRSRYDFCCGRTAAPAGDDSEPVGIRLRLRLEPCDADSLSLCALPWELLWHEGDQGFLGLRRTRSITRWIEVPQPGPPPTFSPPLRLLIVLACPRGAAPLEVGLELQKLEEALRVLGEVDLTILKSATVEKLQHILNKERFHVLHFAGHGTSDAVILETDEGEPSRLHGAQLARLLQGPHRPSLVFLNACETAQLGFPGRPDPADLPLALLQAGIPAVLAMQFKVSDQAAICFCRSVYQALVHGAGLDAAVAEGRLAVHLQDERSLEWATPVLFLRDTRDGELFDLEPIGPILVDPEGREASKPLQTGEPKKLHVFQRNLYQRLDDLGIHSLDDYRKLSEPERAILSREVLDRIIGLGTRPEDLLELRHVNTRFPSRALDKPEIRASLDVLHHKSAIYSDHALVCVPKIELPGPFEAQATPPAFNEDVFTLLLQHRTLIETGRMSVVPNLVHQRGEKFRCLFDVQKLDTVKIDLDKPEIRTFFMDAGELFRPSGALVIQPHESGGLPLQKILEIEEHFQVEYRHFQTHLRRSLLEMHPGVEARALQRTLLEVDEGIQALDAKFEQHRQSQRSGFIRSLASGALAIVLYAAGKDTTSFLTSALADKSLGKLVSFVPDLRQVPAEIRQSPFFVPWVISREARHG